MIKKITIFSSLFLLLMYQSCMNTDMIVIPDFGVPNTVVFEQNLSAYNIYEDTQANLIPSDDYHLLELSSNLFTDYAYKQRLVKVPTGTLLNRIDDTVMDFPDGTILVKTFYYYNDARDTSLGKNIIETRLMIKDDDDWDIATYVWNDAQTDATLKLDGLDVLVSWTNTKGSMVSTIYDIPNRNECITCHQSNTNVIPLGTTLRNLNIDVERNNVTLNQISYLQSIGLINSDIQANQISQIVDYKNTSIALEERARAYLHMNCAHCHNPTAWNESARQNLDFRYETVFNGTGLDNERNQNRVINLVSNGEMPFIGTTLLDEEGVDLLIEYIQSL